ncbi:MAG: methyltransferase domain-containing protein [Candidatus Sericytochromatia bacterium]|nr:methyltransferase domain-containing protein [Candidatus Sericytochromatia bacterium]
MRSLVREAPGLRQLYRVVRRLKHARDNAQVIGPYMAAPGVRKLHVGCGYHLLPGWLNGDLWRCDPSVVWLEAGECYPFADASLDYVFSEHVLEHMPLDQGRALLAECLRVLRPGGRIRVATPDLQFLVGLYAPEKTELQRRYLDWSSEHLLKTEAATDAMVINNYVRNWGHCFIYDRETLTRTLLEAGFTDVVGCLLGESEDPQLRGLENEGRMPPGFLRLETLVLEARRP